MGAANDWARDLHPRPVQRSVGWARTGFLRSKALPAACRRHTRASRSRRIDETSSSDYRSRRYSWIHGPVPSPDTSVEYGGMRASHMMSARALDAKRRLGAWLSGLGWDVWVVAGIACLLAVPLFLVHRPPMQDLPQHAAAVQVLSRYGDPRWNFAEYFELHLARTQYLTVYLAAVPLARLFGAVFAIKAVVAVAWVATPLSVLALLRALGKDGWLSLLVLPLTYNAHAMTGFVNFIAAIPLMFFGIACAIRVHQEPTRRRSVALAAILFVTFYTHVVPYGVLLLAVLALAYDRRPSVLLQRLLPIVPSAVAALVWVLTSPAGTKLTQLGKTGAGTQPPVYVPLHEALHDFADWLIVGLPGEADATRLVLWILLCLLLAAFAAAHGRPRKEPLQAQLGRAAALRLGFLLPACIAGYFWLPVSYDFMWPISLRFPLLAAYLLPLWLVYAPATARRAAAVVATGLAASALMDVSAAFQQFERTELRGFDEVLAQIPHGSRVAGIIYKPRSESLRQPSLLQSVAWVQAERGGAVMFTFADFPQSPFSFRQNNRPPRVKPRWEWEPWKVNPERDLKWYEYVLVQRGPGALKDSPSFTRVVQSGSWSLWKRRNQQDTP